MPVDSKSPTAGAPVSLGANRTKPPTADVKSYLRSCRFCGTELKTVMCDLGMSPLSNSYVPFAEANNAEKFYPLKVWVCDQCLLSQLEEFESPDTIFSDYPYFSSVSTSWVEHARRYCEMMIERFHFDARSQLIEIASNDGYLLQHFKARGIPVLGVEPAANVAKAAWAQKQIPSIVKFFGVQTAKELVANSKRADLLLGNNVLAHVPDINDFVAGLKIALKPGGIITFEFPHLLRLIKENQFDTIYHEHFSYLSLLVTEKIFLRHGLTLFDVEELPTHGGSLRIFARHTEDTAPLLAVTDRVAQMRAHETDFGLTNMATYNAFGEKVRATKRKLLRFLIDAKENGKSVVCYGAAAKGVTLVNYCGVRDDLVDYVVDKSPHKQNHFMPGVRIPIHVPEKIFETKPDYVLILPWNLKKEISDEMAAITDWGGRFVVPIPEVTVL
ncbi:MAG TPA: class I SAM-dependent methyltransferase [Candidatus Udaeobacter sp.]|jgi:2-polyprenyl-3-methyl-5-hydroxy-6-metoxy-1,4-benzoquinol methylase